MYINNLMKSKIFSAQRKGDWNITEVTQMVLISEKKKNTAAIFEKEVSNAKKLRGIFVNLHKNLRN